MLILKAPEAIRSSRDHCHLDVEACTSLKADIAAARARCLAPCQASRPVTSKSRAILAPKLHPETLFGDSSYIAPQASVAAVDLSTKEKQRRNYNDIVFKWMALFFDVFNYEAY